MKEEISLMEKNEGENRIIRQRGAKTEENRITG